VSSPHLKNQSALKALLEKVRKRKGKLVPLSEVPDGGLFRTLEEQELSDTRQRQYKVHHLSRRDDEVIMAWVHDKMYAAMYPCNRLTSKGEQMRVYWLNNKPGEAFILDREPDVDTCITFNPDGSVSGENLVFGYSGQKFSWGTVEEYEAWKAEHSEGRNIREGKRP